MDASTVYVPGKINMYIRQVFTPKIKIWHGQRVRKHLPAGQSIGQISPPPPLTEGS